MAGPKEEGYSDSQSDTYIASEWVHNVASRLDKAKKLYDIELHGVVGYVGKESTDEFAA